LGPGGEGEGGSGYEEVEVVVFRHGAASAYSITPD